MRLEIAAIRLCRALPRYSIIDSKLKTKLQLGVGRSNGRHPSMQLGKRRSSMVSTTKLSSCRRMLWRHGKVNRNRYVA